MNKIILATERLILRPIEASDLERIHGLLSLSETDKYNTLGIPKNIEETKLIFEIWISEIDKKENRKFIFAVELKNENQFIGTIGINVGKEKYKTAEIWFKYHFKFWNKGYGTEALKKIIDFGFNDLKFHRMEAGCAIENIGSIKILEKSGMIREAHKRKNLPLKSGWSDSYGYAILSTD